MIEQHLSALDENLNLNSSKFEKILILGDFNAIVKENQMKRFCDNSGLQDMKKKTHIL